MKEASTEPRAQDFDSQIMSSKLSPQKHRDCRGGAPPALQRSIPNPHKQIHPDLLCPFEGQQLKGHGELGEWCLGVGGERTDVDFSTF